MEDDSYPTPLKVGIAYNLKKGVRADAEDAEAEYDSFGTIRAIRAALEGAGCSVALLEATVRRLRAAVLPNQQEGCGKVEPIPAALLGGSDYLRRIRPLPVRPAKYGLTIHSAARA